MDQDFLRKYRTIVEATAHIDVASAQALLDGKTEKPHGVNPALQVDAARDPRRQYRIGAVPLCLFRENEADHRYDGTVDLERAKDYASREANDVPPVVAVLSARSGQLNIIDGGHRISAARMRGDAAIPVVVALPAASSVLVIAIKLGKVGQQEMSTTENESNRDRKPQFGVPDDVSINVVSWQGQGFFGEIRYNAGKDIVTVPRPNMRCPDDLFPSEAEAHAACLARIEEMTYRATVSNVEPAMSAPVLIFAKSEPEAMVFGRKAIAEFGRAGMSIEVDLPTSQGKFVARREGDDVLCATHFENPWVRPPASEYLNGLLAPRHEFQQRDAMRMLDQFDTKTEVRDGVVRWRSNDRVPPQECLDLWKFVGKPFDAEMSQKARDAENSAFLADYRQVNTGAKPSAQAFAEMRANFEVGNQPMNIVTGDRYDLEKEAVIASRPRVR
ncbi:hypothetical protein IAG25_32930 [Caballeronia sp. EK]|uniref:hypothetical protein n=1 Tax=Caballeronia sp. EK TaxID=2767469 RepID=UPI001655BD05|nr:hypothetical protein [Caballeronia sp. EK]MBC8641631.1 hypothetical protein [Caballeronia sp. EK]